MIVVSFCIACTPFLLSQLYEVHGSSIQSSARPSLAELGTRFEAVGAIFSLSSIDCLGCEFRGIVENLGESQYSIRGEVVVDRISTIIPVSILGTLNVNGSSINGTLSINDEKYTIEGTSTTYSPTCSYCKQTLDLRGRNIQGDDVISANIPLNSIK
ncbi:MAG TPA: hypothetical protein VFN98_05380 [Nitrososphaeraceae archaeon]|nr:hypothetical protein [Nitrososphaeraceae archaeon]